MLAVMVGSRLGLWWKSGMYCVTRDIYGRPAPSPQHRADFIAHHSVFYQFFEDIS